MQALIFRFFDICILRAGPQDLPASLFLLRLVVVLNVITGIFINLPREGFSQSLMISLFDVVLLTVFLYLLLRLHDKLVRFRQSFVAILGTNIIISLLMMPFVYSFVAAEAEDQAAPVVLQFLLLFVVWAITVFAHIIRHSLGVKMLYGFVVSLGFIVLSWTMTDVIFIK